jgi:hypothetical protein
MLYFWYIRATSVAGWVSKCLDSIEAYSQKGNGLLFFALKYNRPKVITICDTLEVVK